MSSLTDDFQTGTLFPESGSLIDEPATITSGNNNTITGVTNDGITFSPTAPPMPEYSTPNELPWGGRPDDPGQWDSPYDDGNSTGYGWTVTEKGPTESYRSGINLGAVFVLIIFICIVALAAFLLCARLIYQLQNRTMNRSTMRRKYGANGAAAAATEEHMKTFHHLQVPHGSVVVGSERTAATYPTSYAATFAASSGTGDVAGGGLGGAFGGGGGCDAGGGAACGM